MPRLTSNSRPGRDEFDVVAARTAGRWGCGSNAASNPPPYPAGLKLEPPQRRTRHTLGREFDVVHPCRAQRRTRRAGWRPASWRLRPVPPGLRPRLRLAHGGRRGEPDDALRAGDRRGPAGDRPRRGLRAVGPRGQPLPRRALHALLRQRRPRAHRARRRGRGADARARLRHDVGHGPPAGARARRAHRRRSRPATSTASSSPPAARSPSSPRSSSPAPTTSCAASRGGRRSSPASSPTTAPPRARSPPRACRPCARRTSRSRPAAATSRTPTATAPSPAAIRCGPPTRSSTGSSFEGPETVAAVILEPVQNSGGCLVPPDGYFQRVREICDRHGVLLISDDTICSWGRLGTWFGGQRFGYVPDVITTAKGITSAYAPMGAVIVSERVAAPFLEQEASFQHGLTFGGHPVAAAVALANIDLIEREDLLEHVRANEPLLRDALEQLRDIPLVGDVRGAGYFWGIELVADRETKAPLRSGAGQGGRRRARPRDQGARADLPRRRPRLPGDPARPAARGRARRVRGDRRRAPGGDDRGGRGPCPVTAPPASGAACAPSTCSPTPAGPTTPAWASSTSPAGSASTRARRRARCARSPSTGWWSAIPSPARTGSARASSATPRWSRTAACCAPRRPCSRRSSPGSASARTSACSTATRS